VNRWLIVAGVAAAAMAAIIWRSLPSGPEGAHVSVDVPSLSAEAVRGSRVFAAQCASCHGEHAAGSNLGPPLVHKIYEPGHHGDASFYAAVRLGVRSHHWKYGDMPPRPEVSNRQVGQIIAYVRELQRANGIN